MKIPQLIIIAGIVLVIVGVIFHFVPNVFNWFGKLPGDIKTEKENSKIYFPITSLIIASIILTIILNIALWIISKF